MTPDTPTLQHAVEAAARHLSQPGRAAAHDQTGAFPWSACFSACGDYPRRAGLRAVTPLVLSSHSTEKRARCSAVADFDRNTTVASTRCRPNARKKAPDQSAVILKRCRSTDPIGRLGCPLRKRSLLVKFTRTGDRCSLSRWRPSRGRCSLRDPRLPGGRLATRGVRSRGRTRRPRARNHRPALTGRRSVAVNSSSGRSSPVTSRIERPLALTKLTASRRNSGGYGR